MGVSEIETQRDQEEDMNCEWKERGFLELDALREHLK